MIKHLYSYVDKLTNAIANEVIFFMVSIFNLQMKYEVNLECGQAVMPVK